MMFPKLMSMAGRGSPYVNQNECQGEERKENIGPKSGIPIANHGSDSFRLADTWLACKSLHHPWN